MRSSPNEELQGNESSCIFIVLIKGALANLPGVNKRPRMKVPLRINKMQPHRRQVGTLAVLLRRIVWCEKTREDHNRVQNDQKDKPTRDFAAQPQACISVRIRGSAQNRSRSARKFPPTRKSVDSRTPPMTTYKSRANIASSRNGPSPGQLITTSMRSDPLNSVPMLNPKREMRGFAAAGSAYRYNSVRRGMP